MGWSASFLLWTVDLDHLTATGFVSLQEGGAGLIGTGPGTGIDTPGAMNRVEEGTADSNGGLVMVEVGTILLTGRVCCDAGTGCEEEGSADSSGGLVMVEVGTDMHARPSNTSVPAVLGVVTYSIAG